MQWRRDCCSEPLDTAFSSILW